MANRKSEWNFHPPAEPSPASCDPWLRLAAGVVLQAGLEGREGDRAALRWLGSADCELICSLLGIDHRAVYDRVRQWAGRRATGRAGKWARRYADPNNYAGGAIVIRLSLVGG